MILVYPAYRRGFYINQDLDTRWPNFQWKVTCPEYCAGWFGSLESAYDFIYGYLGEYNWKGEDD